MNHQFIMDVKLDLGVNLVNSCAQPITTIVYEFATFTASSSQKGIIVIGKSNSSNVFSVINFVEEVFPTLNYIPPNLGQPSCFYFCVKSTLKFML